MSTLKQYRFEAGLSLSELARRAGIDVGTVRRAEKGEAVQELNAYKIAQVLSQSLGQQISIQDLDGLKITS